MPKANKGPHIAPRKDRGTWEIREFVGGKRVRLGNGYGSREEAQARLAEILAGRKPEGNQITVGQIMAHYCNERLPHLSAPENALAFTEILTPFWGNKLTSEVTKGELQRYERERQKHSMATRKKRYSNDTIRREIDHLSACLFFAAEEGIIPPLAPLWKPEKAPSRERWLTRREAAKLIRQAKNTRYDQDYMRLFILLALYTGARKEAILSLRWPQVDLKTGYIDFRPGQKGNKKRSAIPIPRRLLRELKLARKEATDLDYVVHILKKDKEGNIKRVRIGNIRKGFMALCDAANIKGVTPHTLRHTAASWMVQKGVPYSQVGKYLGNSALMIERTYGHMSPDHLKEAAESYG